MKKSVAIVKVDESGVESAVRRSVELSGGLRDVITPGSRVLIKPNLCWPEPSGMGLTTDCRVTEAVTRMVLELNPASVIIGEGSSAGYDFDSSQSTEEAFRVSGTAEVARKLGVPTCNLNRDSFEEVAIPGAYVMHKARIARTALESNVIISLPVFKTHHRTMITLSLKNMKGVLAGAAKRRTHRLGLDKAIADLNSVVRAKFVVVDALAGMQGLWEYPADRFEPGLIIAGADPIAVDTVGACLMGFSPAKVMHLQYLAARLGAKADISEVSIVGESLGRHQLHLQSGFDIFRSRYPGINIIEGQGVCTGCLGELLGALTATRNHSPPEMLDNLIVIMGDIPAGEVRSGERTIILGKCAVKLAGLGRYVKGCPPRSDDMIRAIGEVTGSDGEAVVRQRNRDRNRRWRETRPLLNS